MKVKLVQNRKDVADLIKEIERKYKAPRVDNQKVTLAESTKKQKSIQAAKAIGAPYNMLKLVKLLDMNEYHASCVDVISKVTVLKIECENKAAQKWIDECQHEKHTTVIKLLRSMIKYEQACGNGALIKVRSQSNAWVGLERLLPNEMGIYEKYDEETGFPAPDYYQVRNSKKKNFEGKDVIHMREDTYKSIFWGLNSFPIAVNVETLNELKKCDYNNFRNGMMIDWLIMVSGGTLNQAENSTTETKESGFDNIKDVFDSARGSNNAHSSMVVEAGDPSAKIDAKEMRSSMTKIGQKEIEEKYRNGIFAYHRVPPRLVSQLIPGQLGGDNNSDLTIFYNMKIKPLQEALAAMLTYEFITEGIAKDLKVEDWNFGNLTEFFESIDELGFKQTLGQN